MEAAPTIAIGVLAIGGGGVGLYGAALALGIRHGIDWDHIAAITDITSAASSVSDERESWLLAEPGLQLTDERHHMVHGAHEHPGADEAEAERFRLTQGLASPSVATMVATPGASTTTASALTTHRTAFVLGTLYALGHGLVVTILGVIAILASEVLPSWIDPILEKIVGLTLIFLAVYLFYSVYRFFRNGEEFRIRSRWMLVFAGVANAWNWIRSHVGKHEHVPVRVRQQYGARTAFGIGMIHGIGAETGTQALIIAGVVGATSKTAAVITLLVFVGGLLISNSFVTLVSTVGFVSARRRQLIYVAAGIFAAVFSLLIGLVFLLAETELLPDLDRYVRWIGGPS
jgi:hypothetical protein